MILLLLACSTPVDSDPPATDSPVPPDVIDDVPPGETDSGEETETAAPTPLGRPEMVPKGGGFIGSTTVTLGVQDGEGALQWCFADPAATECAMTAYEGPVAISSSGVLRAQVVRDGEPSDIVAGAFVAIGPDLAGFRSNVPVILYASPGGAPDSSADVALSMVVLEPPKGGVLSLVDPPADSGRARMHARGSSSAGWEKKSWDLELWESDSDADRSDELLGMPANGDWILYAPYYFDEAMIRNPLAFAISEALGRYAPRARFAEVFVATGGQPVHAGNYEGLYVVMEEIERAPERVNLVELLPEDVAEPEVTGGYLFKIDRTGEGDSGLPRQTGTGGGAWDFQQGFVAVQPGEDELAREQTGYLVGRLNSVGNALAAADGVDPNSGLPYDEIMDVDTFIDHHIVNLVMKNPDAFRLSGYMYQDRGGLVSAGPVWDFDRAAASQDSRSTEPTWWDAQNLTSDCTAMFTFGWYAGLFEDPVYAERYWTRLGSVLDAELSGPALDEMVTTLSDDLAEAAARDAARWGQAEFAGEITELRAWLHFRHDWMRTCIDTYGDPRDCPG